MSSTLNTQHNCINSYLFNMQNKFS
uniref:Uncharacterized protein n=1 Tax=Anguilla anguilla TaxID=7936 RepID=A0A0E9V1A1_ANGAN